LVHFSFLLFFFILIKTYIICMHLCVIRFSFELEYNLASLKYITTSHWPIYVKQNKEPRGLKIGHNFSTEVYNSLNTSSVGCVRKSKSASSVSHMMQMSAYYLPPLSFICVTVTGTSTCVCSFCSMCILAMIVM
jgi:hypothetical protein